MYVAKSNQGNIYAVVIRGTVINFSLGTLVNLYEDLDVGNPSAWTYPLVPGAYVANGTLYGLEILTGMRSNNASLFDFLAALPQGSQLFVTGHSLGGCLAAVLAPWLQYQLCFFFDYLSIATYTFAAPTAGNQAFADWYTNTAFPGN